MTERFLYGVEVGANGVHILEEGGWCADGGGDTLQMPGDSPGSNG